MNNHHIVTDSLTLMNQITDDRLVVTSDNAILQRLDERTSKLAAYLITQRRQANETKQTDLLDLVQKIESAFNEQELQDLCFRLNVAHEDILGDTRTQRVRELVTHLNRRGRLDELVAIGRKLRPQLIWQVAAPTRHNRPIVSKVDLAVVVDVARPALVNAAQYLDQRNIAANFLVFRHVQPGTFFAVEDNWEDLVRTFGDVMDRAQREFTGAQFHFFLAGPAVFLFALGCVWGTVYEATVYHFENNTY